MFISLIRCAMRDEAVQDKMLKVQHLELQLKVVSPGTSFSIRAAYMTLVEEYQAVLIRRLYGVVVRRKRNVYGK